MLKKIAFLGLILSISVLSLAEITGPKSHSKKIVAWDIHQVLCSKPGKHGWQCVPNAKTFELVAALDKKGVKQVIFSNISKQSFYKLIRLYPQHFSYFDLTKSMANAQGIFTRKPHSRYIQKFLNKHDAVPGNIIFFDDKESNIAGARKHCMDAHMFTTPEKALEVLTRKNLL